MKRHLHRPLLFLYSFHVWRHCGITKKKKSKRKEDKEEDQPTDSTLEEKKGEQEDMNACEMYEAMICMSLHEAVRDMRMTKKKIHPCSGSFDRKHRSSQFKRRYARLRQQKSTPEGQVVKTLFALRRGIEKE